MTTATAQRQHEAMVLDQTGDTKHIWDPDNDDEVEAMRELFDKFKKKSYLIYRVNKKGDKAEVMHRFDGEAEKMIIAPAVVAG